MGTTRSGSSPIWPVPLLEPAHHAVDGREPMLPR